MEILQSVYDAIKDGIPMAVVFICFLIIILAFRFIHNKRFAGAESRPVSRQLITLLLSFIGLLVLIISSPISESSQGQLLSLIGILLSAAVALSSTTFVGNAMAGLMLRFVKSFRGGDFIKVGDYFGWVTERGLFHIEIQTEDSDLMTLPNLYLVTNPVKVVRSSETIVFAEVSLGFDTPHEKIESVLIDAATDAGLEKPFVYVMDLGDFSVTYRVSGVLKNVSHIITTRSTLRQKMLDRLHRAQVEIVSPTFMNTRAVEHGRKFIPTEYKGVSIDQQEQPAPEEVVFKKAEEAKSYEKLKDKYEAVQKSIEEIKVKIKDAVDDSSKSKLERELTREESHLTWLSDLIAQKENKEDDN